MRNLEQFNEKTMSPSPSLNCFSKVYIQPKVTVVPSSLTTNKSCLNSDSSDSGINFFLSQINRYKHVYKPQILCCVRYEHKKKLKLSYYK